jgi:hypothetical protein
MPNVVEFVTFSLKEGASVSNFVLVSDILDCEFLSKQKGYVSRKLLVNGELWADMVLWETMEDALNAVVASGEDDAACEYMSFIDENTCDMRHFSVEKSYLC